MKKAEPADVIRKLEELLDGYDPSSDDCPITHGEIARHIGIGRTWLWHLRKEHEEIARLVEELDRASVEEWGQSKLKQRINEGSDSALIYFQKAKGKRMGWSDRLELTGAEDAPPVTINVSLDD